MEVTIVSQDANRITVNILPKINIDKSGATSKVFNCGGVNVTFKLIHSVLKTPNGQFQLIGPYETCKKQYTLYFKINPETLDNSGSYSYICTLNSTDLLIKNSKFICGDSCWHELSNKCYTDSHVQLTVGVEVWHKKNAFTPLHNDTTLTDFELRGEGGSVKFHSAVLAAASPVLQTMLEQEWSKEVKDRSCHIKGTSQKTLQQFKDYIYTDVVPETGAEELLLLAHRYMMRDLENRCISKLRQALRIENVMDFCKFALANNLEKMFFSILKWIQEEEINLDQLHL